MKNEHDITEWEEWQSRFVPLIHNEINEFLTARDCSQQCPEIREFRAIIVGFTNDLKEVKWLQRAIIIGILTYVIGKMFV